MAIAVGQRFVRRQEAARSSTSNTTAADIGYDTAVLSEGGYGTWGSDEVTVDTAGKYLYIADLGQVDVVSTRAVGTLVPVVNGVTQEPVGLATHRYLRNSGGAQAGASIGAGILDLAVSDAVGVRNPGAILSVDALGNYATDSSAGGALQLIRLPDNDFLHLERNTDQSIATSLINSTRPWLDSSGTWTKITWPTEVSDTGNWHAASSGDVILPANSKFLIVATTSCKSYNNNRQGFVSRLSINGTIRQSGSGYQRNLSSEGVPVVLPYFHETGGSTETLFVDATMEEETSTAASDQVVANSVLQIILLNASTEWLHADNGAADSLTTALAGTGTWYETPLSSTFRADGGSNLSLDAANNAVQNDSGGILGVLAIGWHRWDRDSTASTTRKVPWARFVNGGTQVGYGRGGAFSRGAQGGWATWQAHYASVATIDMANAADLTLEVNDPASAVNSDMGIYASTNRHFLGLQVLNLSTLEASSGKSGTALTTAIPVTSGIGEKGAQGTAATSTSATTSATGQAARSGPAASTITASTSGVGYKGGKGAASTTTPTNTTGSGSKGGTGTATSTATTSTSGVGSRGASGTATTTATVTTTASGSNSEGGISLANTVYYGESIEGVKVNAKGVGSTQATFDESGYVESEPNSDLLTAMKDQGGHAVDFEGTEEALTPGTVQTATTMKAIVLRNSTGATVLNIRDENGTGTLVVGPITIAAGKERVIVFPTALTFATGVFIDVDSGGLHATPGFLIP